VLDVPFESSDKNAMLEFVANAKAIPPKGTEVTLVITAARGADTAPVAKVQFTVDAFGRITMDGQPIAPEKIEPAIKQFLSVHAEGFAEIRLDARALVHDRERLEGLLQHAGMSDIQAGMAEPTEEVLPRDRQQTTQALQWWKQQFSGEDLMVFDPAKSAAQTLESIRRQQAQAGEMVKLWAEYAGSLKALLAEYESHVTTAPATEPGAPEVDVEGVK
jgi:biopolymer transport protein ExbD